MKKYYNKLKSDFSGIILNILRLTRINIFAIITTLLMRIKLHIKSVKFGSKSKFYGLAYFYRAPNSKIKIGDNVCFRSDRTSNLIGVNHWCIVSTLNRGALIEIGNNSGFSGVSIGASNKIIIGDNVKVGANCVITDTNWHNIKPDKRNSVDDAPGFVTIHNNVFIGYGSIILKNVEIGENSVIGAGSVVTNSIPKNCIAAGNPCQIIKNLE